MNKNKQTGFAYLPIILIIIILGAIGAGGYIYTKNQPNPSRPRLDEKTASTMPTPATSSVEETANWKTYRNEKYGFEVRYPSTWSKDEELIDIGFKVTFQTPNFAEEIVNHLGVTTVTSGSQFVVYSYQPNPNFPASIDSLEQRLTGVPNSIQRISLDGYPALYSTHTRDQRSVETFVNNRNFGIVLYSSAQNAASHDSFFNQILSTFKFTK